MYLGHCRFLSANHPLRKKGKHFKGKTDHQTKPGNRTSEDVLNMVKDVKVVFGKAHGSEPIPNDADGHAPMWKKSIFWELPIVVQCLVSFELVFPPSFFNIMTHLLVHLVKEISILGPVFLHNMFPFERFMGVLKKYVHNRARPEGSIAKGYGTEEVIEFCVDFIPDLDPIGVPESRHEGRLSGKGTLGKKTYIGTQDNYFNKAHYTVLQNSSLVDPYIETHKELLRSSFKGSLKLGLCVSTWKHLVVSCENDVRVTESR